MFKFVFPVLAAFASAIYPSWLTGFSSGVFFSVAVLFWLLHFDPSKDSI